MLMLFSLLPVQALAEEVNAAEPAAVQEEPLAPSMATMIRPRWISCFQMASTSRV